jgi:predicted nucleotidyltransferase
MHRDAIRRMVLESGMANPRVFGSTASGEDHEDSDLDLLVDPSPDTSLLDVAKLQLEIETTVGVKVDLITPRSLPSSFRERVLSQAIPV